MDLKFVLSSVLLLIYLHCANSNIFISSVSSSITSLSKCASICEKTFPLASNVIPRTECCTRGCRFYGIAELVGSAKQQELNSSREACHNCCYESYKEDNDKAACNMGCDTMAQHQREMYGTAPEISWSFVIGPQIIQTGDMLEPDDVLTDPSLRRQFLLDMMDNNKLPEMRVKTLPVNSDERMPARSEWWSDCAVRQEGVPRCLAASLIMLLIVLALWFVINCDEKSLPSPPIVLDPEQAPPLPPKYSLLDDIKV